MQKARALQTQTIKCYTGKVLYVARHPAPWTKILQDAANELSGKLSGVNLEGKTLSKVVLNGVDLSHARLGGASLAGATLQNCIFNDAWMEGVDIRGADISGCSFTGADMLGMQVQGTGLFQLNGLNEGCITIDLVNRMIYSDEWSGPVGAFSEAKLNYFPSTRKVIAAILDQAEIIPFTSKLLNLR